MDPQKSDLSLESINKLPANVKLLGLSSLLNDVASEMIFPLLPSFVLQTLGGSKEILGGIEGAADSVTSLLKLWSGARSDRAAGRKTFVVVGYTLAALARPLIGLVTHPSQLLVIRLSDRIGKGVRTSPRDALIADSTPPELRGRAFGFHRAMDHLGAAIGPVLATMFLLAWPNQMRTLFLLTIIPGVIVVALVAFKLRETRRSSLPAAQFTLTLKPFSWEFKVYLLALVVFTLGNSSDAFLLVRAGELGVPTAFLPLLWTVFHLVKSSGNVLCGRAVDKVGPRPMILIGWLVYALVYLAFGLATQSWHAWALFCGYAVFYALTEPAEKTLVAGLVGAERKGLAFGWYNFAIGVATLPASYLFGWFYDRFGALAAFGWGAALSAAAAALLIAIPRQRLPRAL